MYINSVLTCHFLLWFKWWSISTQSGTLSLSKGSNPYGRAKPALYHSVPLGYFRWVWVPDKLPPIPFLPSKTSSREFISFSWNTDYINMQIFIYLKAIIHKNRFTIIKKQKNNNYNTIIEKINILILIVFNH